MKNKARDGGCGTLLCYQNPSSRENFCLHIGSFDEPEASPPYRDPRDSPAGARD